MKTRSAFLCGFGCGVLVLLCIYLPMYIIKGRHKELSVHYQGDTVLVASRKRIIVEDLQTFAFLVDSNLAGRVEEVRVSSYGPSLCIGIYMQKDGSNAEHQVVFADLFFKRMEKDGSLRFARNVSFETASK